MPQDPHNPSQSFQIIRYLS